MKHSNKFQNRSDKTQIYSDKSLIFRLVTNTVLRKLLATTMPKIAPIVLEVKKAGMKNNAATDVPINKCA